MWLAMSSQNSFPTWKGYKKSFKITNTKMRGLHYKLFYESELNTRGSLVVTSAEIHLSLTPCPLQQMSNFKLVSHWQWVGGWWTGKCKEVGTEFGMRHTCFCLLHDN